MITTEILSNIHDWARELGATIIATPLPELAAAVIAPLIALVAGIQLNRIIDRWGDRSLHAKLIDMCGPLISPVLSIILSGIAMSFYIHSGHRPFVLLMVFKLSIAWLAIYIVRIMASGRTAAWFIGFVIIPVTLLHLFDVWEPIARATNELRYSFGGTTVSLYQVLRAAVLLVLLVSVTNFVLDITENRLKRVRNLRASNRTLIMKFSQIALYVVVFIISLNLVGVSLTTLSIFSGAVGVGVGLGLQKIASNFISGIILLFEKSIEIGDLVMLEDGTEGFVRQTSARYTLIEKFDGAESLVPNENFISQRVDNRTLSHKRGRGQIFVGVAYDSDLREVQRLMVQAAVGHERCSKNPAPAAFVIGFAESAISMQLNFWVNDIENGTLGISSDIMLGIVDRFRANNIIIPYPHQVAILPAEVGEKVLKENRPDLLRVQSAAKKTDASGSKQEAKEIAKAAPISKVTK